ncbi:GDP-perosamine synthase [subsurface metagenome]
MNGINVIHMSKPDANIPDSPAHPGDEERSISQVLPFVDSAELDLIRSSIDERWLTEGPHSKNFLEEITAFTGSKYAVLAPTGTLGLFLGLLALDLPRGSEIIIPSFTFFASASSAVFAGLTPVFVDVNRETYNLDVELVEKAITPETRAIMPVHIYGQACEIDAVMDIARKHDLMVIEDAAQGFGVSYNGRHTGTFGDVAMISFFADKTITTGEGAVVLTQREDIYQRLRMLRNQGRPHSGTFIHHELGMNFRLTDLQCAVGLAQLKKFEEIRDRRLQDYQSYEQLLAEVGDLQPMKVTEKSTFIPFRYFITTSHKERLMEYLERRGIQNRSFFYPMHMQPPLEPYRRGLLPISEALYQTGLCLPLHYYLSGGDIEYITNSIKDFFNG